MFINSTCFLCKIHTNFSARIACGIKCVEADVRLFRNTVGDYIIISRVCQKQDPSTNILYGNSINKENQEKESYVCGQQSFGPREILRATATWTVLFPMSLWLSYSAFVRQSIFPWKQCFLEVSVQAPTGRNRKSNTQRVEATGRLTAWAVRQKEGWRCQKVDIGKIDLLTHSAFCMLIIPSPLLT